ncbi:TetR family transcriptional regulator [Streptomyces sp. P5-A9]|uniref:TetR/AcrR family transcriptional regulator n=1 Tax=Streptomyces sp. P5-A9 TaxID=3071730 RepID=UPI002FCB9E22
MASRTQRGERRTDALSKQRIVRAAIEMLDDSGEGSLTFRALAARLSTGSGALYWHVANKADLLAAATNDVIVRVLPDVTRKADPREAIRAVALGVYEAIDSHPWVGAQLSSSPSLAAIPEIFEAFGSRLQALGVPERAWFHAATTLVHYVLGAAGQNAANARQHVNGTDRADVLGAVAELWGGLDPARYSFVRRLAAELPGHDDQEQFLAGVDLILAGIEASAGAGAAFHADASTEAGIDNAG